MLSIDGNDPQDSTLVGQPANTSGQFPQTVAYSSALRTAFVLDGGAVSGMTCFSVDYAEDLTALDSAPH